jgi:hypothetical protein
MQILLYLRMAEDIYSISLKRFKGNRKFKKRKGEEDSGYYEMYRPEEETPKWERSFKRSDFSRTLRKNFRLRVSHEITDAIPQFLLATGIGLILNYIYYSFFSIRYLFIGGVNQWFSILMSTLNYGVSANYNLLYLVINGIYYFYLYSTFVILLWAVIRKLHRLGTWIFIGLVILGLKLLSYFFPNIL